MSCPPISKKPEQSRVGRPGQITPGDIPLSSSTSTSRQSKQPQARDLSSPWSVLAQMAALSGGYRCTSKKARVAVLYQAIEPPVLNGVRKAISPGGKDSHFTSFQFFLSFFFAPLAFLDARQAIKTPEQTSHSRCNPNRASRSSRLVRTRTQASSRTGPSRTPRRAF